MHLKNVLQKFKDPLFRRKMYIGAISSILFAVALIIFFPLIFNFQLKREMSLRNNTDMKEMWVKIPFPLEFKIWVWNITNPMEVNKGGKPIVQEVGPYVYEKWIEKIDLIENKEEDSIEYTRKDTYYFKPELSGQLTGDEMVYTPHLILIATMKKVAEEKPSFLKVVIKAINAIYDNPKHIFPQARVKDLLFDGVVINCTSNEFAPKAVCNAYKEVDSLNQFEPNYFKFSLFGSANGTNPKRFKVLRGIKKIRDVGVVIEYDGNKTQNVWSGEKCNAFKGTDSTIFRPQVTKEDELWTFSPEICRSIGTVYKGQSSYAGISALQFVADLGDISNETENQCFCPTPDTCPRKGLMDLEPCVKGPIVISLPHFYKVDKDVQSTVIGMNPKRGDHGIYLDFEPISGSPLKAKKRLQLNCKISNIPQSELFADITESIVPMLWIEEGIALNKTFVNMLKHQLLIPLKIVLVLKILPILLGLLISLVTYVLTHKDRVMSIIRLQSATAPSAGNSENAGEDMTKIPIRTIEREMQNLQIPGSVERF